MKKLFGEVNLTWKKVIIAAVIIGIGVGLLNSVPCLFDTTITDIATYFDFWILCGIFIIMNSKSNKEAAIKCFVFFLISQPLIYLAEVPFNRLGWQIFVYYKYWFIWTIFTLPMGYIGYYMKKEKWYSLLILLPMLVLLSTSIGTSLSGLIYSFPHHLINLIFVIFTLIMYPLVIFNNKYLKYIGLGISIVLLVIFSLPVILNKPTYETTLRCNSEKTPFNDTYKTYLTNSDLGEVFVRYEKNLDDYCIGAKFYKTGETKLVIESPSGEKQEYKLTIGKNTYTLE